MPFMRMQHATDPKKEILDAMGNIEDIEIYNNQVLIAFYIRPNVTKGGIHLSDTTREEDKWQGKVGLVIKHGSTAFTSDDEWFQNADVGVGDWVICRPGDGWNVVVHGVMCRLIEDYHIKGKVQAPDSVW